MASPPPPYSNITGVTRAVMKFNAQEPFASYNGNARPGELVVDTSNYALYIGNADGGLNIVTGGGGGGGGSNIANGNSNVNIATSGGIVSFSVAGNANIASINGLGIMNLSDKIVAPNADFSATLIANIIDARTVNAIGNINFGNSSNSGEYYFSKNANSITMGAVAGQNIGITDANGIQIGGTGNVTLTGAAGSTVSIQGTGASNTSNITVSSGTDIAFGSNGNANAFVIGANSVTVKSTNGNLVLGRATATGSPGLSSTTSVTFTANRGGTAREMVLGTDGNLSVGGALSLGGNAISVPGNLTLTANSGGTVTGWIFGTDGKLTLPGGGNITGDGSNPGPKLSGFDFVGTANANVGQTLNVVGNTNLSVLNVSANANLQGGTTISGNLIANITLNTGANPWSIAQSGGGAGLIIDDNLIDISGNVRLPANITVAGTDPAANTTATVTNRLPITINGNTYYIMLTS